MKAIILAGGAGSRLYPLTLISSKQLQPVYDKPMIYYPLTVLIASGIRELCLITTPGELSKFKTLLGDGTQWGISIVYRIQARPEGIAQGLLIAADFIGSDDVILMLGDNIFSGGDDFPRAVSSFDGGALLFAYHVKDPERYGVVEFDRDGNAISLEEKPRQGRLQVRRLSRGFAWLDAGTSTALHEASAYIEAIERRQGIKIGCPEEAALIRGFIDIRAFETLIAAMPNCEYSHYLRSVATEWHRLRGGPA